MKLKKTTMVIGGSSFIDMQYGPSSFGKSMSKAHSQKMGTRKKITTLANRTTEDASLSLYMTAENPDIEGVNPAELLGASFGFAVANSLASELIQPVKGAINLAKGVYDQVTGIASAFNGPKKGDSAPVERQDSYIDMLINLQNIEGAVENSDLVSVTMDVISKNTYVITSLKTTVDSLDAEMRSIVLKLDMTLMQVDEDYIIRRREV